MKLYRFWDESKSSAKFLTPVIKGRSSDSDSAVEKIKNVKSVKALQGNDDE